MPVPNCCIKPFSRNPSACCTADIKKDLFAYSISIALIIIGTLGLSSVLPMSIYVSASLMGLGVVIACIYSVIRCCVCKSSRPIHRQPSFPESRENHPDIKDKEQPHELNLQETFAQGATKITNLPKSKKSVFRQFIGYQEYCVIADIQTFFLDAKPYYKIERTYYDMEIKGTFSPIMCHDYPERFKYCKDGSKEKLVVGCRDGVHVQSKAPLSTWSDNLDYQSSFFDCKAKLIDFNEKYLSLLVEDGVYSKLT